MPDPTDPTQPPVEGDEQTPPAGAEAPEPQTVARPEVPEDLTGVEEDALRELYDALGEYRTNLRSSASTPLDAQEIEISAAEQRRIVEEIERRRTEARQTQERLAELDAMEIPSIPEPEPSMAGVGADAATLAAATTPQNPGEQQPPAPTVERPKVALLASAGTEVQPAGTEMDWVGLGEAIDRAKRGREGQTILASLPAFPEGADSGPYPRALSNMNGIPINDQLIEEARNDWIARWNGDDPPSGGARLGAICAPFDIIREIPDAFITSTPVADVFPSRPAGRGGFQFTRSGVLTDVAAGVTIWNEASQAAVDVTNPATLKPCATYTCPPSSSAVLEWIPACVTFDNTLEMSAPERVRNLNNALAAQRARIWEGRLLQRIDALSSGYVFAGDYGALPAFIEAVNTVVAQLTFVNREALGRYVLLVPPAVPQVLAIDRANRAYGVEQETSDVLSYVSANLEGVGRIVSTLDATLSPAGEPGLPFQTLAPVGNQGAGMGAPDYISGSRYRLRLVAPEAAIYAETGEMNAGTLRDSTLTRANKTGYFTEAGFFLEKQGVQPWVTIDVMLCADGSRAGLIAPDGCFSS